MDVMGFSFYCHLTTVSIFFFTFLVYTCGTLTTQEMIIIKDRKVVNIFMISSKYLHFSLDSQIMGNKEFLCGKILHTNGKSLTALDS